MPPLCQGTALIPHTVATPASTKVTKKPTEQLRPPIQHRAWTPSGISRSMITMERLPPTHTAFVWFRGLVSFWPHTRLYPRSLRTLNQLSLLPITWFLITRDRPLVLLN